MVSGQNVRIGAHSEQPLLCNWLLGRSAIENAEVTIVVTHDHPFWIGKSRYVIGTFEWHSELIPPQWLKTAAP